ncbi:MAG: peptidoglycan-binding protein [Clostridia bacterium]|nr:peptidoglycan-binding protein [Clostridia bacterium]
MAKKIYLSPSNQYANTYAYGNTTEMEQCNKIAVAAEIALKRCGFTVKRAPKGQNMYTSINDSNNFNADVHICIHTNAGGGKGTNVFVYKQSSDCFKYAQPVYNELVKLTGNGRGLLTYPDLAEINSTNAKCVYCECEFHDNSALAKWIINNTTNLGEAIAKGICTACGVKYKSGSSSTTSEPSTNKPTSGNSDIKTIQQWINDNYGAGLDVDGIYGTCTKSGLVKALQSELNKQCGAGLDVDGIFGWRTRAAIVNLYSGVQGNLTKTLQGLLICNGYDTNGFDGIYGNGTTSAVKSYQTKHGLTADGIAGKNTFASLCK